MNEIVELYTFRARLLSGGASVVLGRYTSAPMPVTDGSTTWQPIEGLSREALADAQQSAKNETSVFLPSDHDIAVRFLPTFVDTVVSPEQPVSVLIERAEIDDIDDTTINFTFGSQTQIYAGVVSGASFSGVVCTLRFQGPRERLKSSGPNQRYQRQCRWDLFGRGCGLDADSFDFIDDILDQPSERVIEIQNLGNSAPNFFAGGHAVYKQTARLILSNNTSTAPDGVIVLASPFPFPVTTAELITLYPGCDHSEATCDSKFSNLDNFGGFSRVANENPFRRGIPGNGVA